MVLSFPLTLTPWLCVISLQGDEIARQAICALEDCLPADLAEKTLFECLSCREEVARFLQRLWEAGEPKPGIFFINTLNEPGTNRSFTFRDPKSSVDMQRLGMSDIANVWGVTLYPNFVKDNFLRAMVRGLEWLRDHEITESSTPWGQRVTDGSRSSCSFLRVLRMTPREWLPEGAW